MKAEDGMPVETHELEARLRVLEAKEEIRNLLQEYRRTLDIRDMRAFSALFAANGSWAGASGEATGPEGIYAMLTASLTDNPPWPGPTLWHLITDPADHRRRRPRDRSEPVDARPPRRRATRRRCRRSAPTTTSSSSRTAAGASCGAR